MLMVFFHKYYEANISGTTLSGTCGRQNLTCRGTSEIVRLDIKMIGITFVFYQTATGRG